MSYTTDVSRCERVLREIKAMNLDQLAIVRRMVCLEYERRKQWTQKLADK